MYKRLLQRGWDYVDLSVYCKIGQDMGLYFREEDCSWILENLFNEKDSEQHEWIAWNRLYSYLENS